jgi:hypothetical protein
MQTIIISLIIGVISGAVSAMLIYEAKNEEILKCLEEKERRLSLDTERIKLLEKAVKLLDSELRKTKGALWSSLNDLWNIYDAEHPKKVEEESDAD